MHPYEDFNKSALAKVIDDPTGTTEKLRFGHLEIIERLGKGSAAEVYKVLQTNLNRVVAIKVLEKRLLSEEDLQRFSEEGKIIAKLNHPNIVRVIDSQETEDAYFLSMEFIDGQTLDSYSNNNNMSILEISSLMSTLCDAIQHAHEKSIIHRDLKPSNIMMNKQNKCYITDFGLAKVAGQNLTKMGVVMGTPEYMSPEQAQGEENIDPRTDIYSLGAILYELLTKKTPFAAATSLAIIMKIVREDPISPIEINPDTPLKIQEICLKSLSKKKEDRYKTAKEMGDQFKKYLQEENEREETVPIEIDLNSLKTTQSIQSMKKKRRVSKNTKKYRKSVVLDREKFLNDSDDTEEKKTFKTSSFSQSQMGELNVKEIKRIKSSVSRRSRKKKEKTYHNFIMPIFCIIILIIVALIW